MFEPIVKLGALQSECEVLEIRHYLFERNEEDVRTVNEKAFSQMVQFLQTTVKDAIIEFYPSKEQTITIGAIAGFVNYQPRFDNPIDVHSKASYRTLYIMEWDEKSGGYIRTSRFVHYCTYLNSNVREISSVGASFSRK